MARGHGRRVWWRGRGDTCATMIWKVRREEISTTLSTAARRDRMKDLRLPRVRPAPGTVPLAAADATAVGRTPFGTSGGRPPRPTASATWRLRPLCSDAADTDDCGSGSSSVAGGWLDGLAPARPGAAGWPRGSTASQAMPIATVKDTRLTQRIEKRQPSTPHGCTHGPDG